MTLLTTTPLTPPPFIERFQYKNCKQTNDPISKKRVYQTPDGELLPSVTTILSATKDMTHLNEWRSRVGHDKAQQITTEAAGIGTCLHTNLEKFICGLARQPGNNLIHVKAHTMANIIIKEGLKKIDEVWAMEQSLYFPGLYSGTTDLVAVYNGKPSICDYKQSNRLKKLEHIEDYFLQLLFYITAHNKVYGTDIKEGHIFMCTRGDDPYKVGGEMYQQFDLDSSNWNEYEDKMWTKLEKYYLSDK